MVENGNNANGHGVINPTDFTPVPKNPTIAKFFRTVGLADDLGSGLRNLFRYAKEYSGSDPTLIEEDVFRTIIPLTNKLTAWTEPLVQEPTNQATMQATMQAKLLEFCKEPRTRDEMQELSGFKNRDYFRINILKPLIEQGKLHLTMPDKPTSPKQKYYTASKR